MQGCKTLPTDMTFSLCMEAAMQLNLTHYIIIIIIIISRLFTGRL